jgi:hypothetical protein
MVADLLVKDAVLLGLSVNALVEIVNGVFKGGQRAVELGYDFKYRDKRSAKGHKTRQNFPSHFIFPFKVYPTWHYYTSKSKPVTDRKLSIE